MNSKYLAAILLGSTLLTGAALAENATTTDRSNINTAVHRDGEWRASKLVGVNVYNDANEKIGDIQDVILDKSGKVDNVILGVGGFLGMGAHLVAVPYEKIKFVNEPIAYTGVAGSPNGAGSRPASPVTTGAASGTTTGAASGSAPAKANPWYPDHAVFNATKDQLKAMPEFKYSTE